MKPEYLDSLKSGIKTAIITFVVAIVGVLTQAMSALSSWAVAGNPPDLSVLKGLAVGAVVALAIGVGNAVIRFTQAAAVPVVGTLFDKLIGVVPTYLPPPESPVDVIGDDDEDDPNGDPNVGPNAGDHL